jgi:hypothetical protein
MSKEQKVVWLRQWNEFRVLKGAKKFPKQGFSNIQFDKWLHKATFWYQVRLSIFNVLSIFCLFLLLSVFVA